MKLVTNPIEGLIATTKNSTKLNIWHLLIGNRHLYQYFDLNDRLPTCARTSKAVNSLYVFQNYMYNGEYVNLIRTDEISK